MLDQANHPHLLAWYVSGDLDTSQARQTEEHLQNCRSCREELRALASMMQAVDRASRELARGDLRLEQVETPPPRSPTGSLSKIEPDRRLHSRSISPNGTTPARSTRKAFVIMAGLVGLAGLAAVIATARMNGMTSIGTAVPRASRSWPGWPPGSQTTTPREVRPVIFSPSARGGAGAPKLAGPGPWAIRVVLPLGAAGGTYLVRIEREPHGSSAVIETMAPTDADGYLTLILDTLAEPGHYSLVLALPDPAGPGYSYPFEILPSDAPTAS